MHRSSFYNMFHQMLTKDEQNAFIKNYSSYIAELERDPKKRIFNKPYPFADKIMRENELTIGNFFKSIFEGFPENYKKIIEEFRKSHPKQEIPNKKTDYLSPSYGWDTTPSYSQDAMSVDRVSKEIAFALLETRSYEDVEASNIGLERWVSFIDELAETGAIWSEKHGSNLEDIDK